MTNWGETMAGGRKTAPAATEPVILQEVTSRKEKLPNLPNLPKYTNGIFGIVGELEHEKNNIGKSDRGESNERAQIDGTEVGERQGRLADERAQARHSGA
jgi:hypothetical protein